MGFFGCGLDAQSQREATPSFYISSHARFLGNFNLTYTYSRFMITLNGVYKERAAQAFTAGLIKADPRYFVLNTRVEWALLKNSLSLFAEADNVFDRHYADLTGASMPGRWLMGGIKISLFKIGNNESNSSGAGNSVRQ